MFQLAADFQEQYARASHFARLQLCFALVAQTEIALSPIVRGGSQGKRGKHLRNKAKGILLLNHASDQVPSAGHRTVTLEQGKEVFFDQSHTLWLHFLRPGKARIDRRLTRLRQTAQLSKKTVPGLKSQSTQQDAAAAAKPVRN